jgi:hypothetical protein
MENYGYKTKDKNYTQKWNKVARKIHNEASNIFSLEAFKDCNEISLRALIKEIRQQQV